MQYTRKQHYIPQFIIRNFQNRIIPETDERVWYYNTFKHEYYRALPKDICKQDYLYELRNEDNSIKENTKNIIEKYLAVFEYNWAKIVKTLPNKVKLSNKYKSHIYHMVATQILRTKETLDFLSEFIQKEIPTVSKYDADNAARVASLPTGKLNTELNWSLDSIFKLLFKKHISILHSKGHHFILNCQRPVLLLIYRDEVKNKDKMKIYFPVSKNICILLTDEKKRHHIDIKNKDVDFINSRMYYNGAKFIISDFKYK